MTFDVVSLFSGCGGLDAGFVAGDYRIALAMDNDLPSVDVYNHNLGNHAELFDVTNSDFEDRLRRIENCDVLLGGFPCQGFSKAGPKLKSDERNTLYRAMITAMRVLRPRIFVAENVDGLAQNFSGQFLKTIVSDMEGEGYTVKWKVVDFSWFGVPQHRRRIIFLGFRHEADAKSFQWPEAANLPVNRSGEKSIAHEYPNWSPNLAQPVTLKQALVGIDLDCSDHLPTAAYKAFSARDQSILEVVSEGQKLCNPRHESTSVRTWDIPAAFGEVSVRERRILEAIVRNRRMKKHGSIPNGNPLSLEVICEAVGESVSQQELEFLAERGFVRRADEKWDVKGAMFASGLYRRPALDRPSPTVLTVFASARHYSHPVENRRFTVREVARIQTFPDSFKFIDAGAAAHDAYRMIGNAVPPKMAGLIAQSVSHALLASGPPRDRHVS